ncbi:Riboflavin transporter 2 [Labeo rohita]|uniref:Riboflavin transporter 2 n=1 Tax=Labeo rohita TaxID=84645 RepID=A0ABQ8M9W3_LABRO|nr:Riboflavin transporter 2 [Labeo rohita]
MILCVIFVGLFLYPLCAIWVICRDSTKTSACTFSVNWLPSSYRPCSFYLDSFYLFMAFFLIVCLVRCRHMTVCLLVNTKFYALANGMDQ